VDWKPERAIQAKVRDFQKKKNKTKSTTAEARQWRNTLRWSTNGDFFQTLSQHWALSPRDISCYLIPGFTPSAARLVHNDIISKEVCRVFVLRCHSASNLTCFVSFHRVRMSYAITQSYSHLQFIQSNKSHSFIQLYAHTWILSHINAYTSYTQYQFIHGCIGHPKSCLTVSHQFGHYLSLCLAASF